MDFLTYQANYAYTLGLVGIFVGICLFITGIHHLIIKPLAAKRQFERRLKNCGKERLAKIQILKTIHEGEKSVLDSVLEQVAGWGKVDNLQRHLFQADLFWRPVTFISIVGILFCLGFAGGLLKQSYVLGLIFGAALGFLPILVLRYRKRRKTMIFERQMPECMELLARSMRAGHALPSAIELVSAEIPQPLGEEMKIVYEEQRLGLGMNAALRRMGDRVDSQDLQYFITAVLLQAETGGNLAEIFENIGFLIRERLKLKGKVKALTAEGRFSALVLTLLPFVIFFVMTIMNREYMNPLVNEPVGNKLIITGLLSMGLGVMWMRKIIQIRV